MSHGLNQIDEFYSIVVFNTLLFVTTSVSVVPEYCLFPLNGSDCYAEPRAVFSYYKPGSRCEMEVWRGCPTLNSFPTELHCINKCIFRFKFDLNQIMHSDNDNNDRTLVKLKSLPSQYYNYYHRDVGIPAAKRISHKSGVMEAKTVGGSNASIAKYPYMIRVRIFLTTKENSLCSASLLSMKRALTAAHCCWDGERRAYKYTLAFGTPKIEGGLEVNTTLLEMHKLWDPVTRLHDIAIISFKRINYTDVIKPIQLPENSFRGMDYKGTSANAAGFGKTGDTIKPAGLNEVKLKVISNKDCKKQMLRTKIYPTMMCTGGYGNVGTCGGDSGGPLVFQSQDNPIIIGVTSFGPKSCVTGRPSVYTRVAHYISWIKERL